MTIIKSMLNLFKNEQKNKSENLNLEHEIVSKEEKKKKSKEILKKYLLENYINKVFSIDRNEFNKLIEKNKIQYYIKELVKEGFIGIFEKGYYSKEEKMYKKAKYFLTNSNQINIIYKKDKQGKLYSKEAMFKKMLQLSNENIIPMSLYKLSRILGYSCQSSSGFQNNIKKLIREGKLNVRDKEIHILNETNLIKKDDNVTESASEKIYKDVTENINNIFNDMETRIKDLKTIFNDNETKRIMAERRADENKIFYDKWMNECINLKKKLYDRNLI
jgi:hypothetical protein